MFSRSECRGLDYDRRCSRCSCSHSVSILLKADCAVFQLSALVLDRASYRAVSRFVRHMANRRSRLGDFAAQYVGILKSEHFSLERNGLLDSDTEKLEDILARHNVKIPECLRTRPANLDYYERYTSIYRGILKVWQANMFWQAGFRDLNSSNRPYQNWTPLTEAFVTQAFDDDYSYLDWLIAHGAHPFQPVYNTPPLLSECRNVAGATHAHALFFWSGQKIFIYGKSIRNWIKPLHYLHTHFLHLNLADACSCKCSANGCSLRVQHLKGICFEMKQRRDPGNCLQQLSRWAIWYLGEFTRMLSPECHRDVIRYLTFEGLDATHTCCEFITATICFHRVPPDDIQHVQEEEEALLGTLEELILAFEDQFFADCGMQSADVEQIEEFWSGHWLPRMTEVLTELDADGLSEDARRSAEDIGVVWSHESGLNNTEYGPETAIHAIEPLDNIRSWDYYFNKLDKIVSRDSDK